MHLIDLNEELTFQLPKYDSETFLKYAEEFFDKLHYNVTVCAKPDKTHVVGINEFIKLLNSKRAKFTVEIPETYPDTIFKFQKAKEFKAARDKRQYILSLMFNLASFVGIAKRIKTFLDLEREVVNKNGFFKDGYIYFNLTSVDQFVGTVRNIAKKFYIKFDMVSEDGVIYLKFPVERLMQVGYSNSELSTMIHFLISAFKYIYSIEAGGQDFTKRFQLKAELEKWIVTARYEMEEILKRRE